MFALHWTDSSCVTHHAEFGKTASSGKHILKVYGNVNDLGDLFKRSW